MDELPDDLLPPTHPRGQHRMRNQDTGCPCHVCSERRRREQVLARLDRAESELYHEVGTLEL